MSKAEKKFFLLLLSVTFHYHGLDKEEEELLIKKAKEVDGIEEMEWANEFIARDYISAFERARDYFNQEVQGMTPQKCLKFLEETWKANLNKGFITEMEAQAMIKLAKDWNVDHKLMGVVRAFT